MYKWIIIKTYDSIVFAGGNNGKSEQRTIWKNR